MYHVILQALLRNRNRRNCIILTQEEPGPYPCSRFRFRFLLQKKYQTKSTLTGHWLKLAREETIIMVTGRNLYSKNNLKFKGRNRNLNRNRGKKNWDPEPEPRQNGTVPQHCLQDHSPSQHPPLSNRVSRTDKIPFFQRKCLPVYD